MSRSSIARVAAAAASGALVVAGVTVGVGFGAGTAGAAGAAGTCNQSSQASKNDISTWGITHNYSKTVSSAEAAGGTEVTYTTVVSTTGIGNPYVNTINDIPPTGFGAPVKATVTAYHFAQGQVTNDVTPTKNGSGWKVTSTGWFVNSGNPVTLKMTYKVPGNASIGTQITSGGTGVAGTVGVSNEMPNLTACFTVRLPNPGEATTGSLDMAGLGSAEGQLSSTGSVSDVLGDTITRVLRNGS